MIRTVLVFCALLLLAACGGGGGGGATGSGSTGGGSAGGGGAAPPPPTAPNVVAVTVDAGPTALRTGGNNTIAYNFAYVSVTLCVPGTTTCQTIDHVHVDTGSSGLRIARSALDPSLAAAFPSETAPSGNPVGECFGYVDGYAFGSVRQADFHIGGETVANMPIQVIGDSGVFSSVPSTCSSGGGSNLATVNDLNANGIIGIGVMTTDCGTFCTTDGGYGAAIYYDCPSTGCQSIIARSATTTAPFQQLPNPVAALGVDNNGTILSFPTPPSMGTASLAGTLTFGVGTAANNGLGTATVLRASTSTNQYGPGFLTALYNGQTLDLSYVDSGTNLYLFTDSAITPCPAGNYAGYYCPAAPLNLSPTLQGTNGATASAAFTLNNAQTLLNSSFAVLPGVGGDPNQFGNLMGYPRSFAFGLPFFFGRSIYTVLEGRSVGATPGPFYAY